MTYNKNLPDWQDGHDDYDDLRACTNEPAAYSFTQVLPGESLASVAKRVYGTNNVLNRLRLELANNGKIEGMIKVPR